MLAMILMMTVTRAEDCLMRAIGLVEIFRSWKFLVGLFLTFEGLPGQLKVEMVDHRSLWFLPSNVKAVRANAVF
jgi:hypothetical protein